MTKAVGLVKAKEALLYGNVALAVECALAHLAADARSTGAVEIFLSKEVARVHSWGPLAASGLSARIERLFQTAREPLPIEVQRWFHPPRAEERSVAQFPTTLPLGTGNPGAAWELWVGGQVRPPTSRRPRDQSFCDAVEASRELLATQCDASRSQQLRELDWWVEPDVEGVEGLCGGSVALAAFVAFASELLSVGVPTRFAFTGVLEKGHFVCPDVEELPSKQAALRRERPHVSHPLCPPLVGNARPPEWWGSICSSPIGVLVEVFLLGDEEIRRRLRPSAGLVSVAHAPGRLHDELDLRLLALVAASLDALPVAKVAPLLRQLGIDLTNVQELGRLRALAAAGRIREVEVDGRPAFAPVDIPQDHRRVDEAHRAYAALESTTAPLLAAVHHDLAGDVDLAAAIVRKSATAQATLAELWRTLELVEQRDPTAATLLAQTLDPQTTTLALLRLAWACCHANFPALATLGRRLLACTTWPERLLWLQWVVEVSLHLAAALSVARGDQLDNELRERPSLGLLANQAARLVLLPAAARGAFATDLALANALVDCGLAGPADQLQGRWVKPVNAWLHGFNAWDQLKQRAAGESLPQLLSEAAQLASQAERVVPHVRRVLDRTLEFQDLRDADQTSARVPLFVVAAAAGPLLFRGRLEGYDRYWALADGEEWWTSQPDSGAGPGAAPLSRDRPFPVPAPTRSPAVDRMPTPLAAAWVRTTRTDPLERLAALDRSAGLLLRLALYIVWRTRPAEPFDARAQGLFERPTKRRLWNEVRRRAELVDPASRALVAFLLTDDGLRAGAMVISILERLEHAPGPLGTQPGALDDARGALASLLLAAPWQLDPNLAIVAPARDAEFRFASLQPERLGPPTGGPARLMRGSVSLVSLEGLVLPAAGPALLRVLVRVWGARGKTPLGQYAPENKSWAPEPERLPIDPAHLAAGIPVERPGG